MAERRMIAKTIIDSDAFLDMPVSSQLLYFHLNMRADDDGFVNQPKSVMRIIGAKDDDLKLLCVKKFIIPFESGIIVIKHWKLHNYIAKDRYHETKYKNEKALLETDENNSYRLIDKTMYTDCIQPVHELSTQVRLGKVRLGKDRLGKDSINNSADAPCISSEIIAYLNQKAGTEYKDTTKNTIALIDARLKEGFTLDNFKTVIDKKCAEWKNTEFEKYLRPGTLFAPSKFEGYLNEKKSQTGRFDNLRRNAELIAREQQ